jgi:ATP adenylyltransferase
MTISTPEACHDGSARHLGTLIVAPREHIVAVTDLDDAAALDLGLWSHGVDARKHLHFAVQPVTAGVLAPASRSG